MARRAETSGAVGLVVVDSHETFEDDFEMAAEDVTPKPKPERKTSGTDGGCVFVFVGLARFGSSFFLHWWFRVFLLRCAPLQNWWWACV